MVAAAAILFFTKAMQSKAAISLSAHLVVREITRQWKKRVTASAADVVRTGEDFEDWDIYSLRERVKLVQDFDRFCDDVLSEVRNILDNFEVDEDIVYVPQTVKRLREAS